MRPSDDRSVVRAAPKLFDLSGVYAHQRQDQERRLPLSTASPAGKKLRANCAISPQRAARPGTCIRRRRRSQRWLTRVYRGWCNYHAIPGNSVRLQQFRTAAPATLAPRVAATFCQRGRRMTWTKFSRLSRRHGFPSPRILHPYPESAVWAFKLKVRAVCSSSARTDLCEGDPQGPVLSRHRREP